jgi:poly(3-hydroxybutyrate) depolymerase
MCSYPPGVAGAEVVLVRVDGGGHALPGPDELPWWYRLVVGPKNHDISASDEIRAFFERNPRRLPAPRLPGGRVGE